MTSEEHTLCLALGDFEFERLLGRGGFGEVWLGTHRSSGQRVAIKKVLFNERDREFIDHFLREVRILSQCRFPHVLRLVGYWESPEFCIVTPYIPNGSLYDHIRSGAEQPLNATQKTLVALGIAYAMMRLHDINIVHRDLKSMNVLLDNDMLPIVCDFGISRVVGDSAAGLTSMIGTVNWMAPEQLTSDCYDSKVDVYAFGMVLFEMLTGEIPFAGLNPAQVIHTVCERHKRPQLPSSKYKNKSICALIQKCWDAAPKKRPTFRNIFMALLKSEVSFDGTDHKAIRKYSFELMERDKEYKLETKRNEADNVD